MQKLATIEEIKEIRDIPDADRIQLAVVQGYSSVIKKGEYKAGDKVVFVYIDTLLQPAPWNAFLADKHNPEKPIRIQNVKLRKTLSSGVIFPLSILGENNFEVGDDVAEVIGCSKYEKPIPACLAGTIKGNFPTHLVTKTDEDNALSYPEVLDEILNSSKRLKMGIELVALLKYDGASGSAILDMDNEFRVCSRNLELKEDENNIYWKMAKKYYIEEILRNSQRQLALQFEIVGPNLQKNPLELSEQQIFIFLIKDLDNNCWFSWNEIVRFCGLNNLPIAKELFRFDLDDSAISWNLNSLQEKADKLEYNPGKPAEGFVLRTVEPMYSEVLGKDWWSVKFINRLYKD